MPWYGVLIVAVVVAIAAMIVTWILSRRSKDDLLDQAAVAEAHRKVAKKQAEAEKSTRKKIKGQNVELALRLKNINIWYLDQMKDLKFKVRRDYEKMAGDPVALDRKLDKLLADD